jgi:cyclic pyranopterin phosphate synthase
MDNNIDGYGRSVSYMRVSVTPRCNLKCAYCMPEGEHIYPAGDILTIKEITRLIKIFSSAGIRKVRLTGGEPLVRKGIARLVSDLKDLSGIDEVTLTTNGVLLGGMIKPLKEAGLDRINISLDTLQPERMRKITGYDVLDKVLGAVDKIITDGTWPLKLNVVAIRGVNDDEILDFAALAARLPLEVRFIEMMPTPGNSFNENLPLAGGEIEEIIRSQYRLIPIENGFHGSGPALAYDISGGAGRIGIVSPMSKSFCRSCNRLRLTAEGRLRSCLFSEEETDLKSGLLRGEPDRWFLKRFYSALQCKPEGHGLDFKTPAKKGGKPMTLIGG